MTLKIVKYEKGMKVTYPDQRYVGKANLEGMWINKDGFGLNCNCPEGFSVQDAELIPMQEYYLRGKVMYADQCYVFTAKVDLQFFDNDDYQQLLNTVFQYLAKSRRTCNGY